MVRFKKILAVFLAVCILSLSVGSSYKVEAGAVAAGAALTAKTVFDICLFIGCTLVTCYAVGEIIDNRDEIARAGKNFIDSLTSIPEGWIFKMTDASGQEYVFGSEALELVQEMDWEVIQGGGGSNNDNNDDDDNKNGFIDGLLNLFSPANELIGSFTALGATWFYDTASNLYQKWVNGDEMTELEAAVIEPLINGVCNQYDIAAQWSGEPFYYDMTLCFDYNYTHPYTKKTTHEIKTYDISFVSSVPVCAYIQTSEAYNGDVHVFNSYSFGLSYINDKGYLYGIQPTGIYSVSVDGVSNGSSAILGNQGVTISEYFNTNDYVHNLNISFSGNLPFFMIDSSPISSAVNDYLRGVIDADSALNYAKIWREADWLADDWQGLLVDPLVNIGLSLSQLADLAKALGLHAVGNDLTPSELADLIAESLPEVNPELLPDQVGVPAITPNPDLDPIYFPYPGAHPDINPDPNPDPDPNPKPGTETDIDMNDYKVNLTSVFPFCIPFDFITLLDVLDAEPVAPRFEFPVVIPALDYQETVIIDMSIFDEVAEIIRLCETISFIIFLMFATSKVIRW